MKRDRAVRSRCPISTTLDTLGDRWSLIVVRDMMAGKSRFSEFLGSEEGIKRNILAERLRRLEAAGIVTRVAYQERPVRYEYKLTRRGVDLLPILQAMARWANTHTEGTYTPGEAFLSAKPEDFLKGK